jgi:hypothetical protein
VRYVGDQLAAQLLLTGQRVGHLVEGFRQIAQLSRSPNVPARAERSPRPIARATTMSRATGRVIRRDTASATTIASSAAVAAWLSPATGLRGRRIVLRQAAPAERTMIRPTRCCRTTTSACCSGLDDSPENLGDALIGTPVGPGPASRRPGQPGRGRATEVALAQPSERSHAARQLPRPPGSGRIAAARPGGETSAATNTAVSPASRATAVSATLTNVSASRARSARRPA